MPPLSDANLSVVSPRVTLPMERYLLGFAGAGLPGGVSATKTAARWTPLGLARRVCLYPQRSGSIRLS